MSEEVKQIVSKNIVFKTGDIFTTEQKAFGHGVNCYGLMDGGIARIVKNLYPAVFSPYEAMCNAGHLVGGEMFPVQIPNGPLIFNLASQERPGANASYEFLEGAVSKTFQFCAVNDISGFALPRIGAGIGGLEWDRVVSIISKVAERYPNITVELWSQPEHGSRK